MFYRYLIARIGSLFSGYDIFIGEINARRLRSVEVLNLLENARHPLVTFFYELILIALFVFLFALIDFMTENKRKRETYKACGITAIVLGSMGIFSRILMAICMSILPDFYLITSLALIIIKDFLWIVTGVVIAFLSKNMQNKTPENDPEEEEEDDWYIHISEFIKKHKKIIYTALGSAAILCVAIVIITSSHEDKEFGRYRFDYITNPIYEDINWYASKEIIRGKTGAKEGIFSDYLDCNKSFLMGFVPVGNTSLSVYAKNGYWKINSGAESREYDLYLFASELSDRLALHDIPASFTADAAYVQLASQYGDCNAVETIDFLGSERVQYIWNGICTRMILEYKVNGNADSSTDATLTFERVY